jgi:predicted DNA-binding transcriptional regulator AlpA
MSAKPSLADLPDWPGLLSVEQGAAFCSLSRNTFLSLVKRGKLPAPVKLPVRRKLWSRAALEAAFTEGNNGFEQRKSTWRPKREGRPTDAR